LAATKMFAHVVYPQIMFDHAIVQTSYQIHWVVVVVVVVVEHTQIGMNYNSEHIGRKHEKQKT
jgi:ABC-type bacteriocin/lantibiotic exporter with double-glycine peptidase domain